MQIHDKWRAVTPNSSLSWPDVFVLPLLNSFRGPVNVPCQYVLEMHPKYATWKPLKEYTLLSYVAAIARTWQSEFQ